MLVCIALIPVIWTLLLPNHTNIHAGFMVRIFVIPIAIAPLSLFWPRAETRRKGEAETR
jgi:hypothetical protein